jgi:hypothetical protein
VAIICVLTENDMTYDDWKTESPEDERERLDRFFRRRRGNRPAHDDSPEASAYWDQKIDEALGK